MLDVLDCRSQYIKKKTQAITMSESVEEIVNGGIDVASGVDEKCRYIYHTLYLTVLEGSIEYIPASWWQHFKQDIFPKTWLKRWPVKYRTVELCVKHKPDIDSPCETFILTGPATIYR